MERGYGEGWTRVGEALEIDGDIYTLTVLAMLRDDEIGNYLDILTLTVLEKEEGEDNAEEPESETQDIDTNESVPSSQEP